jgi:capsular polysaccharide biosynthesis protein
MSAFTDERPDSARYFDALRQHWKLIAVLVVTAVAAAALYSVTTPKRYEAKVDVLVTPVRDDDTLAGINVLRESGDPTRTVVTAARLAKTREIAAGVRARLGASSNFNPLGSVDVKPIGQANIVSIIAHAETSDRGAAVANAFADELIEQRRSEFQSELEGAISRLRQRLEAAERVRPRSVEALVLQERLADLSSYLGTNDPTLRIVSRADPPASPVWPRPKLSIAVALLAALLLGIGVVVALEFIDPRVNREDELLLAQRLPVLARVPRRARPRSARHVGGIPRAARQSRTRSCGRWDASYDPRHERDPRRREDDDGGQSGHHACDERDARRGRRRRPSAPHARDGVRRHVVTERVRRRLRP